jgi:hypothetical protein
MTSTVLDIAKLFAFLLPVRRLPVLSFTPFIRNDKTGGHYGDTSGQTRLVYGRTGTG